jgi:hypothetical protein
MMARDTKRKPKPPAGRSVIFPDTVIPKNQNEIILSYVTGIRLPKKSVAFYLELANRTLRDAGMEYGQASFARTEKDFKQKRPPSPSRLTENTKHDPAIFKAWRLISLHDSLNCLDELTAKILLETLLAGKPADGFENLPSLIDQQNAMRLEIGELGAEIQGHKSERLARIGKTKVKGAKALAGSAVKTIPFWDRPLLALLKLHHRSWSDRHIVREALKNPPAEVRLGTFGHGSYGSLRKRVAVLRSQHSLPRINPRTK